MNKSSKYLNILSIVIAIVLLLYALFNFIDNKFSAFLILIGAVIVSPLSKLLFKSMSKNKLRFLRVGVPILTILLGTILSVTTHENQEIDLARKYLKAHPELVFLKQIDTLRYYENYFSGAYENDSDEAYLQKLLNSKIQSSQFLRGSFKKEVDSALNITKVIFSPEIGVTDTLINEFQIKFENKFIKDYDIVFEIDKKQNIKSVSSIVSFSNLEKKEFTSENKIRLSNYINQKQIENQTKYINARLNMLQRVKIEKEFVENCFNAWNGSHIALVRLVKENMHDPKSFEHVETSYKILGEEALIIMKYRGHNKLGVLVLNQVEVKVNIKDCQNIIEINH